MEYFDIKMDFPPILFPEEIERNSFYEDALPSERIEATGFFQVPTSPGDK